MRRAVFWAFLLLLGSAVLGATVFKDQIAHATGSAPVTEQNVDANGFIRVHEQGDVNVTGTVALGAADSAKLDTANEHLANIDTQTAHVDAQTAKLSFDGDGNLKTAPQGTQTVHVDNASVQTSSPPADFSWSQTFDLDPGHGTTVNFNENVLVSLVVVSNIDDSAWISFRNYGFSSLFLRGGGLDGADNYQLPLAQPIKVNNVGVECENFIENCKFTFSVVGTVAS